MLKLFFTLAGVTWVFYLKKRKKKKLKSCLEKLRWRTRGKQSLCDMKCYWLVYLIHKLLFCIFQNIIRLWRGKKLLVINMESLSSRKIYLNLQFFVRRIKLVAYGRTFHVKGTDGRSDLQLDFFITNGVTPPVVTEE